MAAPRRVLRVHTLALSPYGLSFMAATASSSDATRYTDTTGPNVSSRNTRASGVTPSRMVGS
jgi:hypothetical protein